MAEGFVRAKCTTTRAVAALPPRALALGHITNWVAADGPVPDRPKPAAFPRPSGEQPENVDADSSSADTEQE